MFQALSPRLVNNKKLQQFTINSGRDEIRGERRERQLVQKIYLCPQDHFVMNMATLFRCLSHKEETQRGGVVDDSLCIHFRCGGGEKANKDGGCGGFLHLHHLPCGASWWWCLRGGWWQDKQREGAAGEEQQGSGDYKLRGARASCRGNVF